MDFRNYRTWRYIIILINSRVRYYYQYLINLILTLVGYQRVYDLHNLKEIVPDSRKFTFYYYVQNIRMSILGNRTLYKRKDPETLERFYIVLKYLNNLPYTIIVKATPSNIARIIDRISVDDLCKTMFSDIMSVNIYYDNEHPDESVSRGWSDLCALNSQCKDSGDIDSWIEGALMYQLYRSGKINNSRNSSKQKIKYEVCTLDDLLDL